MKKRVAFISIISVSLFFSLLIGELYARFTYKQSYLTGFVVNDPVFHHLPPPRYSGNMNSAGDFDISFTTNNRGMRGPGDYAYHKDKGTFRIAILGDSFTFGVGVRADETFCAVLQDLLDRKEKGRYEICNFGVNSYSPILEYIYLKNEVIKYNPDLVILMLDLCDIQDDYLYEPHIIYSGDGEAIGCDPFKINGMPDLNALCMRYSRLFYILDQKLFQSIRKIGTIGFVNYFSNKFRGVRNKTEILENRYIDNVYFDRFLLVREGKDKDIVMRHWNRTAKYITMIKKYLDKREVKFILVVYPYGHQVGGRQWAKGRTYWAFKKDMTYDSKAPFSIIEDFARQNDIDFLNMRDRFVDKKDEALYFNSDGHWTIRGQEIAASAIFDFDIFKRDLGIL